VTSQENSLQGYKLAIEMGVDIIEVDFNKTSDGY
jgi:glycerophosphoryl diester phosphodiesterase